VTAMSDIRFDTEFDEYDDTPPPTDAELERMIAQAPDPEAGYRPRRLDRAALAAAEGERFELYTISDLQSLPDPEWLIEGVLPADSFAVLFGAPGSTKSFWALDAACCIAAGYRLHGSAVKQGPVIYSAGEGMRGLKWRMEAWMLAHPDADREALERNLRVLPRSVRLLEETDAVKLMNTALWFGSNEGLRLLIIDTWARALTGGDENSAQDAGLAIDVCETVRHRTGATALIVHHTGADGTRERGSTALRGAADTQMRMEKDEKTGVATLHCVKMKDSPDFEDRRFMLSQYGHSAVLLPHEPSFGTGMFQGGTSKKKAYGGDPF